MYLSSTLLAFLGGVLRCQTDGNISPMDAGCGWIVNEEKEHGSKSAVPDAYCRFHCYEV